MGRSSSSMLSMLSLFSTSHRFISGSSLVVLKSLLEEFLSHINYSLVTFITSTPIQPSYSAWWSCLFRPITLANKVSVATYIEEDVVRSLIPLDWSLLDQIEHVNMFCRSHPLCCRSSVVLLFFGSQSWGTGTLGHLCRTMEAHSSLHF